jgi:hypothetical protein
LQTKLNAAADAAALAAVDPFYLNNGSNSATVPFYRVSCAGDSDTGTLYDNNNVKMGTNASIVSMSTNWSNKVSYNTAPTYCNNTMLKG